MLHECEFKIAIVSLTWSFAAEWFTQRFGADYSVGQGLSRDGTIAHFWPQGKALWLTRLATRLGIDMRDPVAVGDSRGDIPMLLAAGRRYWVRQTPPPVDLEEKVIHKPAANILHLAHRLIEGLP